MELSWGKCAVSFPRLTCGKTCTAVLNTQAFQISPLASGPLLCQLSVPLKNSLYAFEHHQALMAVEVSHRKAVLSDLALPVEGKQQPIHELFHGCSPKSLITITAEGLKCTFHCSGRSASSLAKNNPDFTAGTVILCLVPLTQHHTPRTAGQQSAKEELVFTCKVNIKSLHYCALLFPVSGTLASADASSSCEESINATA